MPNRTGTETAKADADEARGRRVIAQWGWDLIQAPQGLLPEGADFIAVREHKSPFGLDAPPRIVARDATALAVALGEAMTDQKLPFVGRVSFDELTAAFRKMDRARSHRPP